MKLVANDINKNYFRAILENAHQAVRIDLAVAYISDDSLFEIARRYQIPFRIWCRIDEEVSLRTLEILEKNLNYPECQLFATHDYLHCKVIWLHGIGCYVGSANLTRKALLDNIEIGTFIEEGRDENEYFQEVATFFDSLQHYTSPIVIEDIKRIRTIFEGIKKDPQILETNNALMELKKQYLEEWEKLKAAMFRNQRVPFREPSTASQNQKRIVDEWKRCQKLLMGYTAIYRKEYQRPKWVGPDVPYSAELDKMFDWYYSNYIKGEQRVEIIVEEQHQKNRDKSDDKIRELFRMWSNQDELPDEWISESFEVRVPTVRKLLNKDKIRNLNTDEVAQVVYHCYALMDHIDKFRSYTDLRLPTDGEKAPREVKAKQFAKHYLSEKNEHGKSFLDILYYFIWDTSAPPWEKIWECTDRWSKWKYPGIDRSTLGELIGLARPDEYPVRNNRTSRVLYALGVEVDHF